MSATANANWAQPSATDGAPLELLRDEGTAPGSHADTDQAEEEAFIWRTAAIGAVVGFAIVLVGVTVASLVVGLDAEKALGLGGFLAFWGGGGFGFMTGGLLSTARAHDATTRPAASIEPTTQEDLT